VTVEELAALFEANRPQLRSVAYRMLGSVSEADDAVQETWLRLSRRPEGIENLSGWLTTVVARVSLDMLRSRRARREEPFSVHVPEPIVGDGPEEQALIADSVGLALLVVLETLEPAERLAFVLHDMFAVPFEQIAPIVDRSPAAARKLASRARRRVRGAVPEPDADLAEQRTIVDAFMAAARDGDFEALVAVLDPDVVIRVDRGTLSRELRGAEQVASQALVFRQFAALARPVLVNGAPGFLVSDDGNVMSVAGFTIARGRITEIDLLADPARLRSIEFS
jgi:RNA polymerase sigma-70 factor (ECF subfamily)